MDVHPDSKSVALSEVEALETPKRLYVTVYERVKELILSGRIAPGVKLDEEMLSRRFRVSRTPVREAVLRLVHEGLAHARPHRGAYVKDYTKAEILEIFDVREALEGLVARLAVQKIDDSTIESLREVISPERVEALRNTDPAALARADQEFHETLFHSTGNRRLIDIMTQLNDQMQMVRMKTMFLPGRLNEALQETYEIIDALAKRDPDLAEQAARRHIQGARRSVKRLIDNNIWPMSLNGGQEDRS